MYQDSSFALSRSFQTLVRHGFILYWSYRRSALCSNHSLVGFKSPPEECSNLFWGSSGLWLLTSLMVGVEVQWSACASTLKSSFWLWFIAICTGPVSSLLEFSGLGLLLWSEIHWDQDTSWVLNSFQEVDIVDRMRRGESGELRKGCTPILDARAFSLWLFFL